MAWEFIRRCLGFHAGLKVKPNLERFVDRLTKVRALDRQAFISEVDTAKLEFVSSTKTDTLRLETMLFALKIANLFVVRRDYDDRVSVMAGRQLGFMVDTANGCNLGCATCANTSNQEFAERVLNPWPKGIMKAPVYDRLIEEVGPWAFTGHFYNNSEPYLNKLTHEFIKKASQLRVRTSTSSNMSVPKLDVEAIVASGLDEIQIAIDGVTQPVYERYRRGGDINLVFENVRRLVEAKQKAGSVTPFIRWHYLTFEHNVHQLDMALEKAKRLGIDFFFVVTPNDVSSDDPSIKIVAHDRAWRGFHLTPIQPAEMRTDISPASDLIETAFCSPFMDRFVAQQVPESDEDHCDWLYSATVSDAMGRTFPCCIGDTKGEPQFQFGAIGRGNTTINNSIEYQTARSFVSGSSLSESTLRLRCETCRGRPVPQVGLDATQDYLRKISPSHSWLTTEVIGESAGWRRDGSMMRPRPRASMKKRQGAASIHA